jgi:hypothetical protein
MMHDYPLTGVGEGAYIVELPNYLKMLNRPFPSTDSAENYFLQAGAELGLAGLLLTLWLFWEIVKRMAVAGRHRLEGGADRFILIGGISGIVGLLVNFLFHSYVGAFEVQYIFWLQVAVIASWPAFGGGAGVRAKLPPMLKWAALSLAILCAGFHLGNSLHSLSLTARTDRFGWDQDFGLYELERDNRVVFFRWAKKSAGISVSRLGQEIVVPLLISHPDVQENPVRVRIYQADRNFRKNTLLREVIFREKAWTYFEHPLPGSGEGKYRLVFETDRSWEPAKVSGVPDPRSLAVGLGEIWFKYPSEWAEEKSGPVDKTVFREWEGDFGADLIGFGTSRIKFFTPSGSSALRLQARGQKALEVGPMIVIRVDDKVVAKTMLTEDDWMSLVITPGLAEGEHVLSVEFTNDFYDPESGADRNVFLGPLEVLKRR